MRTFLRLRLGCCTLLLGMASPTVVKAQAGDFPLGPAYEVATIKPSHAEGDRVSRMIKPLPGANGYIAENFPVRLMIALMYKVPLRQVEGGPGWLDDEFFDIEAHADGPHSKDELQAMFRTLLRDRFGLRMHTVAREGKVFALRADGLSPKLQVNPSGPGMDIPITPPAWANTRGAACRWPTSADFSASKPRTRNGQSLTAPA